MHVEDVAEVVAVDKETDPFAALSRKPLSTAPPVPLPLPAAIIARMHGFDADGRPLVADLPGLGGDVVVARSTVPLDATQPGCVLVLVFEEGDVRRPIVVGVLQDNRQPTARTDTPPRSIAVQADDERVVIAADREIVLCCGDSSITLTKAGKVLIQGTYVSSRSSGVNRIKGGSVQIN